MSSVQREISGIPKSHTFSVLNELEKAPIALASDSSFRNSFKEKTHLLVKGQGVLLGKLLNNQRSFSFSVYDNDDKKTNGFKLKITANAAGKVSTAQFYCRINGKWELVRNDVESTTKDDFDVFVKTGSGLDPDIKCHYWFSLDSHNRLLRYGKGEVRKSTLLAELHYKAPHENQDDPFEWVSKISSIFYTHDDEKNPDINKNSFIPVKLYRDPLTVDPAMYVVPTDSLTMDDIARNRATVVANLTPTCQQLYNNVAGAKFELNTPDFPHFTDAIEASIASPQGWCYKTLKSKSTEFGGEPNPDQTYLRITMGVNQGDSPGVPFVMEIWPPGHYSPVHNHANANAVIRVLHGEITVNLYPMLSLYHLTPFAVAKFAKGDVTWISPDLNQTHQLRNANIAGPTCITIQCYMYGEGNTEHYDYFDYLESNGQTRNFTPNSDCDFLGFKEKMKQEWLSNYGSGN
ncbi:MAG: cysteine dioxygenase family protein [Bacteroidia bacterium]|nr:cysteine dioxygenase family protein [Bacteroidia bacterium]